MLHQALSNALSTASVSMVPTIPSPAPAVPVQLQSASVVMSFVSSRQTALRHIELLLRLWAIFLHIKSLRLHAPRTTIAAWHAENHTFPHKLRRNAYYGHSRTLASTGIWFCGPMNAPSKSVNINIESTSHASQAKNFSLKQSNPRFGVAEKHSWCGAASQLDERDHWFDSISMQRRGIGRRSPGGRSAKNRRAG